MARVTHVKRAQQRYQTVPVLDENGEPRRTPVMRKDGTQKTTKKGKPVFMVVTAVDKTKPKANLKCDFPGCAIDGGEIQPGTPYMHISPRSGPYGGRQRNRHQAHRPWDVWEYSSSLSARLAQVSHDVAQALDDVETPDDVQSALDDAAQAVTEIAEEKRESASNIEEGFGHPTSASEELESTADELEQWAEEISGVDIPELPEPEERWFVTTGDGVVAALFEEEGYDSEAEAEQALDEYRTDAGTGENDDFEVEAITPDEPSADQLDEWREAVRDACSVIDESPV